MLVRFPAVLEILVQRRAADRTRPISTGDPLLDSGDSPALERYRLAKAMHAELDLAHRKGELIDVEKCRSLLHRWGSILRRAGDRLQKQHGTESGAVLHAALDECQSVVEELDR